MRRCGPQVGHLPGWPVELPRLQVELQRALGHDHGKDTGAAPEVAAGYLPDRQRQEVDLVAPVGPRPRPDPADRPLRAAAYTVGYGRPERRCRAAPGHHGGRRDLCGRQAPTPHQGPEQAGPRHPQAAGRGSGGAGRQIYVAEQCWKYNRRHDADPFGSFLAGALAP